MYNEIGDEPLTHVNFRAQFIQSLSQRALRLGRRASDVSSNPRPTKRTRVSHINPSLPLSRFDHLPHSLVKPTGKPIQKRCRYCSFLKAKAALEGNPYPKFVVPQHFVTNVRFICAGTVVSISIIVVVKSEAKYRWHVTMNFVKLDDCGKRGVRFLTTII